MAEGVKTLNQRIQEQTMKSAQDFYNASIGRAKGLLHSDRAELESLLEHLPESQREAKAQVQEMVGSYVAFESTLDEMARNLGAQVQGAEDAASEATQQAPDTKEELASGGAPGEAPNGAARKTQRAVSELGDIVETTYDESGNLLNEEIVGKVEETARQDGEGEEPDATEAAAQKAEELGVDLNQLIGSGSGGRITVKDVVNAAEQGGEEQETPEATEAARQRAEELGVNLNQLAGSGSGGRITLKDVVNAAARA